MSWCIYQDWLDCVYTSISSANCDQINRDGCAGYKNPVGFYRSSFSKYYHCDFVFPWTIPILTYQTKSLFWWMWLSQTCVYLVGMWRLVFCLSEAAVWVHTEFGGQWYSVWQHSNTHSIKPSALICVHPNLLIIHSVCMCFWLVEQLSPCCAFILFQDVLKSSL